MKIVVPSNLNTAREVFELFNRELSFPDYFGWNWDALYDLLCDLTWLEDPEITVEHHGFPCLTDRDQKIFRDLLEDVEKTWKDNPLVRVDVGEKKQVEVHRVFKVHFAPES